MKKDKHDLLVDFPHEKLWDYVAKTSTCWEWTRSIKPNGYGQVGFKGNTYYTHRVSYIISKGQIQKGHVVDHVCRNRRCVNPNHLRAVTQKINSLENSSGAGFVNSIKTHCPKGHPYFGDTLLREINKAGVTRRCLICRRATSKKAAAKRTPERREELLSYWRAYYIRRKSSV